MNAKNDTTPPEGISALRDRLRQFASDRNWGQFHTPKNLATALCVEAAELLEHFQWLREGTCDELSPQSQAGIREELADVLLYLVMLADKLDVDLVTAAHEKLALNAEKYPVEKAKGTSRKYTEL
jgi:NTP pyrophosphatase (non-canonical NTP hydrolase)